MADLTTSLPRTPIVSPSMQLHPMDKGCELSLRIQSAATRYALRMGPDKATSLGEIAGFKIDQPINTVTGTDCLSLKTGPDEWLLIALDGAEDIEQQLGLALESQHHSLVEVSHRNVAFELAGTAAEEILNAGCPLDLDHRSFSVGAATRTIFGKVEIVLARLDDPDRFRLECWRSFACHVEAFIRDAALSAGHKID